MSQSEEHGAPSFEKSVMHKVGMIQFWRITSIVLSWSSVCCHLKLLLPLHCWNFKCETNFVLIHYTRYTICQIYTSAWFNLNLTLFILLFWQTIRLHCFPIWIVTLINYARYFICKIFTIIFNFISVSLQKVISDNARSITVKVMQDTNTYLQLIKFVSIKLKWATLTTE